MKKKVKVKEKSFREQIQEMVCKFEGHELIQISFRGREFVACAQCDDLRGYAGQFYRSAMSKYSANEQN